MEMDKKYKIIFVSEDKIEYYGEPGEGTMHSIYLTEYIKRYYEKHPFLGKLNINAGADSLAYALTYFEHIAIIMNETKIGADGRPKYGTFACLELPPVISEKLEQQILSLIPNLNQFSQFVVESSLIEQNYLTAQIIDVELEKSVEDKIKKAISIVNRTNELERKK